MFALPDHHLVTRRGHDAAAFAQAQFMSDVAALADGDWQWSGWLMPKGRVIALFALLRADAETIALVLHDADPAQFAAQRSEEHTSELQSLMRISYAVFCLKKKKQHTNTTTEH